MPTSRTVVKPARSVSRAFFAPMQASRAGVLFSGAAGSADWPVVDQVRVQVHQPGQHGVARPVEDARVADGALAE